MPYEDGSTYSGEFSSASLNWGFTPIGLEVDFTNWPDNASSFFEVGFDSDIGFQFPLEKNYFSISPFFSMAPAFNFNLGKYVSLRFTPGLQVNFDSSFYTGSLSSVTDTYFDFYLAFSMNTACNIWFSDGIGLKLGFDIDLPLIGFYENSYTFDKYTYGAEYAIVSGGFDYRFFVGLTFRWETRHYLGHDKSYSKTVKVREEASSTFQSIPPAIPQQNASYHAVLNGSDSGPYTSDTVRSLISAGIIHSDTLLWTEGFATWLPASQVAEFADLF